MLPAPLPHLAAALDAGGVHLDQATVIREHLMQAAGRAHPDALEAAEHALVASATGAPDPLQCHADTAREHAPADDGERGCEHVVGCEHGVGCDHCATHLPLPPDLLAVQARAWVAAIDPDGPAPSDERQRAQRAFTLGQRSDGMWVGKLMLPPDQGTALRLARDAHNAPRTATRRGSIDDRTTAQRQADTLVGLVTRAMELSDAPRIGGEAATVVVTITADQLAEHAATGAGTAHIEHTGDSLPAHVAARIICDGHVQISQLDEAGLPLKLGRSRRTHTPHQRRAILTAYPGGCQNPGCHAPPGFTEIHHAIWWSNKGATDTDNGIPLCRHCHTQVHAGRLRCFRDAAGRWHVEPTLRLRSRLHLAA